MHPCPCSNFVFDHIQTMSGVGQNQMLNVPWWHGVKSNPKTLLFRNIKQCGKWILPKNCPTTFNNSLVYSGACYTTLGILLISKLIKTTLNSSQKLHGNHLIIKVSIKWVYLILKLFDTGPWCNTNLPNKFHVKQKSFDS